MASVNDVKILRKVYEDRIEIEYNKTIKNLRGRRQKIYNRYNKKIKDEVKKYLETNINSVVNTIKSVDTYSAVDYDYVSIDLTDKTLLKKVQELKQKADLEAKRINEKLENMQFEYDDVMEKLREWEIENIERVINKEGLTKFEFKF